MNFCFIVTVIYRNNFGSGGGGTNFVAGTGPIQATGGNTVSTHTVGLDVYRAHIFTSSGAFAVTRAGDPTNSVEYLVVAGGGGGGASGTSDNAGAGGAGAKADQS